MPNASLANSANRELSFTVQEEKKEKENTLPPRDVEHGLPIVFIQCGRYQEEEEKEKGVTPLLLREGTKHLVRW